jgi:hypothetical protein
MSDNPAGLNGLLQEWVYLLPWKGFYALHKTV